MSLLYFFPNDDVKRSRKRLDGFELTWRLLYVGNDTHRINLPYIIQWDETDEKRRVELKTSSYLNNDREKMQFAGVHFAVNDLNETSKNWKKWLKLKNLEAPYIDEKLQAKCSRLTLPGGDFIFCSPIGEGIVSDVLASRGENPFQVNFVGTKEVEFISTGAQFYIEEK